MQSSLRILNITTGLGDGGAEATLFRLCCHDKHNKHYVISLTGVGKYFDLLIERNIQVFTVDFKKKPIYSLFKLMVFINKIKPDVVQTWMYHADLIGGLAAKLSGINNIFWGVHNTILQKKHSKISTRIVARINAFLSYVIPKKIIYCANSSRSVHEIFGYNKNGVVIFNGYDLQTYQPFPSTFPFLAEHKKHIKLGMVARFDPYKDHENLIKSLSFVIKKHHDICVYLVGSGVDGKNTYLIKLIEKYDLMGNVVLLGQSNDIVNFMNGIDIHVLSSSAEAFPNVLCESMSCSTPCVTTDVGDAKYIVSDTGWVVKPKDAESLSKGLCSAIEELKNDPHNFNKRKVNCIHRISTEFSIEHMTKNYSNQWNT